MKEKEEKIKSLQNHLILDKIFKIAKDFDIGVKEKEENNPQNFFYKKTLISVINKNDITYNVTFVNIPNREIKTFGVLTLNKLNNYDTFKLQRLVINKYEDLDKMLKLFFQIVENTIKING